MSSRQAAPAPNRFRGWRRIVQASPDGQSRFRTLRGERAPTSTIVREIASGVWTRAFRRQQGVPWVCPAAIELLDEILEPDWQVFEFGSGSSTAWYASRCASVTSLESDHEWYQQVTREIASVPNATVEWVPAHDFTARLAREPDDTYDLIVVDGNDSQLDDALGRVGCVKAAMTKVKPGRVIMLDNSDRPRYGAVDQLLEGWRCKRVIGYPVDPLITTETSFYWRP